MSEKIARKWVIQAILSGQKNPRIHHLDELATLITASDEVSDCIEDFIADYMIARYPDADANDKAPFQLYNREIALEKVSLAKHIFKLLKTRYEKLEEIID